MTDDQLTMFDEQPYGGTPPYEKGSDTSRAAAVSLKHPIGSAASKRRRVFEFVSRRGVVQMLAGDIHGGATDDEIEQALSMRHQTASARRRELVIKGFLKDSGYRRRTSSGRYATIWEVVDG